MSMSADVENPVALGPYLRNFAIVYLLTAIAVAAAVYLLNITSSAMGVIAVMASASLPAQKFAQKNQRVMTTSERLRFAFYGTLLSIGVTALLFSLALLIFVGWDGLPVLFDQFLTMIGGDAGLGALAGGIACLINFIVIYFAVGMFGRQALKALQK